VDEGLPKVLITGVGYRQRQGKTRSCSSATATDDTRCRRHEIKTPDNTTVEISDRQAEVGQVAAEIRRWRKPEPLKGQGHQV
jgi:large subunit ribosomal protein L6